MKSELRSGLTGEELDELEKRARAGDILVCQVERGVYRVSVRAAELAAAREARRLLKTLQSRGQQRKRQR